MNATSEARFVDDGSQMVDFLRSYTVACPKCGCAAKVSITKKEAFVLFAPRRLTCTACGTAKDWASQSLTYPDPEIAVDWYFRLPFYFQKKCAGHLLWVSNREHLEFLRSYVGAKHRTRKRDEHGWKNKSLASRISKWISEAKNRESVLSTLDGLEQKMKMPNQRPERNAGATSPSNSESTPGVAHP